MNKLKYNLIYNNCHLLGARQLQRILAMFLKVKYVQHAYVFKSKDL